MGRRDAQGIEIIGPTDEAAEHFRTALENIQKGINKMWARSILGAADTPLQVITSFDHISETQQVMILWGCGHSVTVSTKPGNPEKIDELIDDLPVERCQLCNPNGKKVTDESN